MGIHGESGAERFRFEDARDAMARMTARLLERTKAGPLVALLNNLGGTTPLEMAVLAGALLEGEGGDRVGHLIGPAPMMTSLDMHGVSLTLMPADEAMIARLAEPVAPHAWPAIVRVGAMAVRPMPDGLTPLRPSPSRDPRTAALLAQCCDLLTAMEADLNALDARSGDGDTGSTLAGAARALKASIPDLPLADLTQLWRAIGDELSQTMGGSSGVLLAIYFAAVGDAAAGGRTMIDALGAGLARVQEVGGARLGDRTMIDALDPALAALPRGLSAAASAARQAADATAAMGRANAGRASYVSRDQLIGHNDPGAEAVARLFEGLAAGSR